MNYNINDVDVGLRTGLERFSAEYPSLLTQAIRNYVDNDGALLLRDALEERHRALRQAERDLHIVLAQYELVRRRQEILDDPDLSDLTFAVSCRWLFHKSSFPCANSLPRKS